MWHMFLISIPVVPVWHLVSVGPRGLSPGAEFPVYL